MGEEEDIEDLEAADELRSLDDQAAELYEEDIAEEGGFGLPEDDDGGSSYYNENPIYDAEDSPEPDADLPNDFSSPFADFGDDGKAYSVTDNDDDDGGRRQKSYVDDDDDYYDDMPQSSSTVSSETFEDDFDDENEDGEDGEDGEDDEDDDDDDEDGVGGGKKQKAQQAAAAQAAAGEQTGQAAQAEKDKYSGAIKWRPGQPITFKLLQQVWHKIKLIEKVRPMCERLNKALETAIFETGPNLALRFYIYNEKFMDSSMDTIDCLLKLATSNGKRLTYTGVSVVKAIFTQEWLEPTLIASFNEMTLQAALTIPVVKAIAVPIFTVAVPILNAMERRKQKKNQGK